MSAVPALGAEPGLDFAHHLAERAARELSAAGHRSDPLAWAAFCAADSARLLLEARLETGTGPAATERTRTALLDALAAARAAVGAAAYAAREPARPPDDHPTPDRRAT